MAGHGCRWAAFSFLSLLFLCKCRRLAHPATSPHALTPTSSNKRGPVLTPGSLRLPRRTFAHGGQNLRYCCADTCLRSSLAASHPVQIAHRQPVSARLAGTCQRQHLPRRCDWSMLAPPRSPLCQAGIVNQRLSDFDQNIVIVVCVRFSPFIPLPLTIVMYLTFGWVVISSRLSSS